MPEPLKLYLDQMFRLDVAEALRAEGHDVLRASETGQARSDDAEILQKAITDKLCTCCDCKGYNGLGEEEIWREVRR